MTFAICSQFDDHHLFLDMVLPFCWLPHHHRAHNCSFHSTSLHLIQSNPIPFHSTQPNFTPSNRIQSHSTQPHFTPSNPILFHSIPIHYSPLHSITFHSPRNGLLPAIPGPDRQCLYCTVPAEKEPHISKYRSMDSRANAMM